MPRFLSANVEIDYDATGAGEPVLLIHGFASTARVNWIDTGWVRTLSDAGYTAITFDNRGHGSSGKVYDPQAYGAPIMAEDARRLLDHLGIAEAHVMGYSMGARIAAFLAIAQPRRVRSLVLAGLADLLGDCGEIHLRRANRDAEHLLLLLESGASEQDASSDADGAD